MKTLLSCKLPFVLVMLVPVIQSGWLRLGDLVQYQWAHGAFAGSLSDLLALLVAILCLQAKLALVPFDQAEAESEIMSGALIEYSGAPLALFKLTKAKMFVVAQPFLVLMLRAGWAARQVQSLW